MLAKEAQARGRHMVVLVRDKRFVPDDWRTGYVPLAAMADWPDGVGADLSSPALTPHDWARLEVLLPRLDLVRIRLRHFGDIAALDLAHRIRAAGYAGRLRAHGAVLARAYTLMLRAGFDEIELDHRQAARQPAEHWRLDHDWQPLTRRPHRGELRRGDAARR